MRMLTKWDISDIQEERLKYLMDEEGLDEEEAQGQIEHDDFQFEWESMVEYLTELMEAKQKKYDGLYWRATVNNFGWRNLSGHKVFKAETGIELLRGVLPECDCTFHIFNWRNGFCIRNWHHDSPTGNEYYYIVPIQSSTYYKENGCY